MVDRIEDGQSIDVDSGERILKEQANFARRASSHVFASRGRFALETWKRRSDATASLRRIEGNEWANHL
jgi:hypothetical protein